MIRQHIPYGRGLQRIALVAVLMLSTGCTATYRNHGYIPLEEDLSAINVGVDTRETVSRAVGTPTSGGIFNESGYYYVASRFRHFAFLEPDEISREVLAISFNEAGTVSNIERFGLEDGQVVALSRRVTDTNIQDFSFINQLLGSIGNFNAATLFGDG